jgi:hypothetical protein
LSEERGLLFFHPRCYLIVGAGLSREQIRTLRQKERNTPVEIFTYDDLLAFVENTVSFVKSHRDTIEAQQNAIPPE